MWFYFEVSGRPLADTVEPVEASWSFRSYGLSEREAVLDALRRARERFSAVEMTESDREKFEELAAVSLREASDYEAGVARGGRWIEARVVAF